MLCVRQKKRVQANSDVLRHARDLELHVACGLVEVMVMVMVMVMMMVMMVVMMPVVWSRFARAAGCSS